MAGSRRASSRPEKRDLFAAKHAEVDRGLQQHARIDRMLQGRPHGMLGCFVRHEDKGHALAFIALLNDLRQADALVCHAARHTPGASRTIRRT